MTRRTRSFLIDGSQGRMFTGTADSNSAASDKLIAGPKQQTSITYIKPKSSPISVVTATKGTRFSSNGLITSVTYNFDGANTSQASPSGRGVIILLRKVSSSGTSNNIASYTLPVNVLSGTVTSSPITITSGDSFFWDVTQIGTTRPGQGLYITTNYYLMS